MCVDVEVAGPWSCFEPRDGFLDLKTFLKKLFISLVTVRVKIDYYISEELNYVEPWRVTNRRLQVKYHMKILYHMQHGLSTSQSDKLQFTKDHFRYEDNYAHRAGPRLV